jgi:hypothetical protein
MLNRDQVLQAIKDACPHCNSGLAVERRPETGEHIHRPQGPMSVTLCLATNLREKYKDVLNG